MQRSSAMNLPRQLLSHYRNRSPQMMNQVIRLPAENSDVFINHRGIDTKRTIASLLYQYLRWLNIHPFLDDKNMKPGDKLFEKINGAILGCKIGVAVFSPRYCDSYFCLHELALMMESKKKVIPIFCDIKPSELRVLDNGIHPSSQIKRFNWALEEAKHTVGLTFNSLNGNWSDVVTNASDIVIKTLMEMEENERERMQSRNIPIPFRNTPFYGRIHNNKQ